MGTPYQNKHTLHADKEMAAALSKSGIKKTTIKHLIRCLFRFFVVFDFFSNLWLFLFFLIHCINEIRRNVFVFLHYFDKHWFPIITSKQLYFVFRFTFRSRLLVAVKPLDVQSFSYKLFNLGWFAYLL